ncbi:MAG: class I SAM-dependent methyltransferase [Candidatus Obscuribacterales bacterium]|nr:class I SAM-dependent methyltransferase [Candidatus Obscuribacterales bacterium]
MDLIPQMSKSNYYHEQEKISGIAQFVSTYARKHMFSSFLKALEPDENSKVLDVGVTCDRRADSNFFEKMYPHSERITAVGIEDARFLEADFPGLKYVQADALNLPFADKEFDIAVSWAVIEHVGSRSRQEQFMKELMRVSKRCFVTTPNRWYPIEFHTVTAFLHWLPPETFRSIIRKLNMEFFASEDNLNLLDEKDLLALVPPAAKVRKHHFRLLGPISNLVVSIET